MYTKARDEIFDMECKIHRLEDKLLRSKNPYEQMEIQSVLRVRRMQVPNGASFYVYYLNYFRELYQFFYGNKSKGGFVE